MDFFVNGFPFIQPPVNKSVGLTYYNSKNRNNDKSPQWKGIIRIEKGQLLVTDVMGNQYGQDKHEAVPE